MWQETSSRTVLPIFTSGPTIQPMRGRFAAAACIAFSRPVHTKERAESMTRAWRKVLDAARQARKDLEQQLRRTYQDQLQQIVELDPTLDPVTFLDFALEHEITDLWVAYAVFKAAPGASSRARRPSELDDRDRG